LRSKARSTAPSAGRRRARAREISVFIVDDDDAFRTGLSEVLVAHGLHVAGTAADGKQALDLVPAVSPDVVLMDFSMPGLSGVETTRQLRAAVPTTDVLMLTISGDEDKVVDAMIAGACGYVLKGTSPASLVADIHAAAEGDCVISTSIAAKLFQSSARRRFARVPSALLSERELEILTMIADGKRNSEIAEVLVLSRYTVRNHISNVLRKLQLENRTQVAGYAARHGLANGR
jgi:DNA-binding NarL/FixJ family response regulator